MPRKKKTLGLALGSGGVKGMAHIGVIKTLLKHGISIDYICGSSIGAWVAGHYALYRDIEKLEKASLEKKKEKFFILLEPSFKGGLVKGKKAEKLLSQWLDDSDFSASQIPLKVVATDLVSGKPVVFSKGKMAFAIRASMSVPGIAKPVEYKGKLLVDGGISNPVPDDVAHGMGADVVISVNLDNYQRESNFTDNKNSLFKTVQRSFDIMRYNLAKYSINNSDVIIEPIVSTGAIGFSDWKKYFTKDIGWENLKIGQKEAENKIEQIKELLK